MYKTALKAIDRLKFQYFGRRDFSREMIFGIGLSKTGTTSLNAALEIIGYKSIHYAPIARVEGQSCCIEWPWWMEKYNAATDLPVAAVYRELFELYPNARFLLTVRDRDAWLASCEKHFTKVVAEAADAVPKFQQSRKLVSYMYGQTIFDPTLFGDAYSRHVDGVMDFFANKGSLTVLDFPGGDGWDVLCGALGKEIPSADFPIRNVRREKGASSLHVV